MGSAGSGWDSEPEMKVHVPQKRGEGGYSIYSSRRALYDGGCSEA